MSKRKTHAEFIEQIKDRPFIAITKYEKSKIKMRFQCNVDGHIWDAIPSNILSGNGCPLCGFKIISSKKLKGNEIISDDGFTLKVDISTESHKNAIMLIDKSDYLSIQETHKGRIFASKAKLGNTKYALISGGHESRLVHRMIIDGDIIDHKNGNGLDNRRSNIRACTCSENLMNSKVRKDSLTGVLGVNFRKQSGKYMARICVNGKAKHLGTRSTIEEAAELRRDAELKYFGAFAPNHKEKK